MTSSIGRAVAMVDGKLPVIISFFSSFFLTLLLDQTGMRGPSMFVLVILVFGFVLWTIVAHVVQTYAQWIGKRNPLWSRTVHNVMDVGSTVGVFVIVQYSISVLRHQWDHGTLSDAEAAVLIVILLFSLHALLEVYRDWDALLTQKR